MVLKGPEAQFLLKILIVPTKSLKYVNLQIFHNSSKFLGNRGNPSPRPLAADNVPRPCKTKQIT